MTKADRIRKVAKAYPGWSSGDIAEACRREGIECTDSYVRTAARQRIGGRSSESDLAYLHSPLGKTTRRQAKKAYVARFVEQHGVGPEAHRCHTDPAYRERHLARKRARYAANPERARQRGLAYYYENRARCLEQKKAYRARKRAERISVAA